MKKTNIQALFTQTERLGDITLDLRDVHRLLQNAINRTKTLSEPPLEEELLAFDQLELIEQNIARAILYCHQAQAAVVGKEILK